VSTEVLFVERDRKVVVATEAVKGGKQDRVRGFQIALCHNWIP
jgi:hypothetical protein